MNRLLCQKKIRQSSGCLFGYLLLSLVVFSFISPRDALSDTVDAGAYQTSGSSMELLVDEISASRVNSDDIRRERRWNRTELSVVSVVCASLAFGFFLTLLYIRLSLSNAYLYSSLAVVLLSIATLTQTLSAGLFTDYPFLSTTLWFLSTLFAPVAIISAHRCLFEKDRELMITALFYLYLFLGVLGVALRVYGALSPEMENPLRLLRLPLGTPHVLLIIALVGSVVLWIDSGIRAVGGDSRANLYFPGMMVFLLFYYVFQLAEWFHGLGSLPYVSHWGLLGYAVTMVVILMEDLARERRNSLMDSHELLVANAIGDVLVKHSVVVLDPALNIVSVNSVTEEITGHKRDELILSPFSNIVTNAPLLEEEIYQVLRGETIGVSRAYYRRKNQTETPMDITITKVSTPDEGFVRVLLSGSEIEERKNLARSSTITKREAEVIQQILSGKTNRDAAESLNIKERTVKSHITSIYNKLGVSNKMQLINALDGIDLFSKHSDGARRTEELIRYLFQSVIKAKERYAQTEALRFIDRLFRKIDKKDLQTRYDLLKIREEVYKNLGRRLAQKKDIEEMIHIANKLTDETKLSKAYLKQGQFYEYSGLFQDAIQSAKKVTRLAEKNGNRTIELEGLLLRCKSYWRQGDYKLSQKLCLQGIQKIATYTRLPHKMKVIQGDFFLNLGIAYDFQGNHSKGKELIEQALILHREANSPLGEGNALNNLGIIAYHRENYEKAERYYLEALAIYEKMSVLSKIPIPQANLGEVYWMRHDYFNAYSFSRKALDNSEKLRFAVGAFNSRYCLSMISELLEDHSAAYTHLSKCLRVSKEIGDKGLESMALAKKALVGDIIEQRTEHLTMCKQALKQAREISALRETSLALSCLGVLYANRKKTRLALKFFNKALKLRLRLSQNNLAMEIKTEICDLYSRAKKMKKAHAIAREIAEFLIKETLFGTEKPIRMFGVCYQTLTATNDPLAEEILSRGRDYLRLTMDTIPDELFRKQYADISYIVELTKTDTAATSPSLSN